MTNPPRLPLPGRTYYDPPPIHVLKTPNGGFVCYYQYEDFSGVPQPIFASTTLAEIGTFLENYFYPLQEALNANDQTS